jgi:hypothetical protein
VSAETLELRRVLARQYEVHLMQRIPTISRKERDRLWRECSQEYARVGSVILDRPTPSWGQIAEIAEIAWRCSPKRWGQHPNYGDVFELEGWCSLSKIACA